MINKILIMILTLISFIYFKLFIIHYKNTKMKAYVLFG
jgi:hypothetical protein